MADEEGGLGGMGEEADFDGGGAVGFEKDGELLFEEVGWNGREAGYGEGGLGDEGGGDRERLVAVIVKGEKVGLEAGTGGGVESGDGQGDGRG